MSNHITRGTLPNPISMSPVALFSPACLRSPESSPTHPLRSPPNEMLVSSPRSATTKHPLLVPPRRSISLAVSRPVRFTPPSGDPWPNRAEHGLGGLSIECHFRWPIMGNNFGFSDGDDFANFRSLRARRDECNLFSHSISVSNLISLEIRWKKFVN